MFTGTAAEVEAAGTPARLAELVLSRTHALPPEDRPVVWAAAVLDGPVGRDELIAVSGLGASTGSTALLRALEGAALAELGDDRYGFAVPLAACGRARFPAGTRPPGPARAGGESTGPQAARALGGCRRPPQGGRRQPQMDQRGGEGRRAGGGRQL